MRFEVIEDTTDVYDNNWHDIVCSTYLRDDAIRVCERLNQMNFKFSEYRELKKENEELKQQIGELLYQIGYAGKNNKTCRECEYFIPENNICYMWDMEVEADDVVVACDQRKVRGDAE